MNSLGYGTGTPTGGGSGRPGPPGAEGRGINNITASVAPNGFVTLTFLYTDATTSQTSFSFSNQNLIVFNELALSGTGSTSKFSVKDSTNNNVFVIDTLSTTPVITADANFNLDGIFRSSQAIIQGTGNPAASIFKVGVVGGTNALDILVDFNDNHVTTINGSVIINTGPSNSVTLTDQKAAAGKVAFLKIDENGVVFVEEDTGIVLEADLIPSTTGLTLGSSLNPWQSIYAQNSIVSGLTFNDVELNNTNEYNLQVEGGDLVSLQTLNLGNSTTPFESAYVNEVVTPKVTFTNSAAQNSTLLSFTVDGTVIRPSLAGYDLGGPGSPNALRFGTGFFNTLDSQTFRFTPSSTTPVSLSINSNSDMIPSRLIGLGSTANPYRQLTANNLVLYQNVVIGSTPTDFTVTLGLNVTQSSTISLIPSTDGVVNLGTTVNRFKDLYISNEIRGLSAYFSDPTNGVRAERIVPITSSTSNLGVSGNAWNSAHITNLQTTTITPIGSGTGSLGTSTNVWKDAYVGTARFSSSLRVGTGFTAPAALLPGGTFASESAYVGKYLAIGKKNNFYSGLNSNISPNDGDLFCQNHSYSYKGRLNWLIPAPASGQPFTSTDFTEGLSVLLGLNPQTLTLNDESGGTDHRTFVGLTHANLASIYGAALVTGGSGGNRHYLDFHRFQFMIINALKEINTRLTTLGA